MEDFRCSEFEVVNLQRVKVCKILQFSTYMLLYFTGPEVHQISKMLSMKKLALYFNKALIYKALIKSYSFSSFFFIGKKIRKKSNFRILFTYVLKPNLAVF